MEKLPLNDEEEEDARLQLKSLEKKFGTKNLNLRPKLRPKWTRIGISGYGWAIAEIHMKQLWEPKMES